MRNKCVHKRFDLITYCIRTTIASLFFTNSDIRTTWLTIKHARADHRAGGLLPISHVCSNESSCVPVVSSIYKGFIVLSSISIIIIRKNVKKKKKKKGTAKSRELVSERSESDVELMKTKISKSRLFMNCNRSTCDENIYFIYMTWFVASWCVMRVA